MAQQHQLQLIDIDVQRSSLGGTMDVHQHAQPRYMPVCSSLYCSVRVISAVFSLLDVPQIIRFVPLLVH